ncbi:MAG: hypothetical protein RDV48_31140 [Candidatus Eremiobacteraeota bacterium]|nr:hypothetical protein [Candidatus Eremiobacteraeota bacterium]
MSDKQIGSISGISDGGGGGSKQVGTIRQGSEVKIKDGPGEFRQDASFGPPVDGKMVSGSKELTSFSQEAEDLQAEKKVKSHGGEKAPKDAGKKADDEPTLSEVANEMKAGTYPVSDKWRRGDFPTDRISL